MWLCRQTPEAGSSPQMTPSKKTEITARIRVKNQSAMQRTQVQSLGREDPLEEGMATHSSILA